MAFLQTIRTKMAWLLIGGLGLALLAFILSDFFSSGSTLFNKFRDKAFVVDGIVVTTGEYQTRIEEMTTFRKQQMRKNALEAEEEAQLREEVYQQMVMEILLNNEAEKLGLAVTPTELQQMVYGPVPYQALMNVQEYPWFMNSQTGRFDKNLLDEMVSIANGPTPSNSEEAEAQYAYQQIWKVIENQIKYRRLAEKYAFLLASGVQVGETESKAYFDAQNVSANIAYVLQPYTSVADSLVKIEDSELKALYEKRKSNFKLNSEIAKVSYFVKDVVPSDEDIATVEAEMEAAYEKLKTTEDVAAVVSQYSEGQYGDFFVPVSILPQDAKSFIDANNVGDVSAPVRDGDSYLIYKYVAKTVAVDSLEIQMIGVPEMFNAESNGTSVADSLINVVKGGKDFAALAIELNPNPQAGQKQKVSELDLMQFGLDGEKCTQAAPGQVLKLPYAGGQYTMLVKIVSKDAPVVKVKLAEVRRRIAISDKTQNAVDHELAQFMAENSDAANFDKAVADKGYGLMSNVTIYPQQPTIDNISGSRTVIHWIFNGEKNTMKKFDFADKRVIAVVKSVVDSEYSPMSEVADMLKVELIRDKKAEKIIADLKAKNLTSLDAYAQELNTKVDTTSFVDFNTRSIMGLGNEPVINAYAFAGKPNQLYGPVKGNRGVFVLSLKEQNKNTTAEYNPAEIKTILSQNNFYQLAQFSLSVLQQKAEIQDNRVRFY